MRSSDFTIEDLDGVKVFVYKWEPDAGKPKAIVQIAHGVVEHAGRYAETAERLCAAGFACYADDHRGHGRTAGSVDRLGILGPGGWESVVLDLKLVADRAVAENPGLPLFYLGHSWGSLLGQDFIQRWGSSLSGAIFIGSTGNQSFIVRRLGPLLSRILVALQGPEARSGVVQASSFGAYNRKFLPSKTDSDFDWICRDEPFVRSALADPYCCFRMTNRMAYDWGIGIKGLWTDAGERRIPPSLPLLFLSGTEDAVNDFLRDLKPLIARYRGKFALEDLTEKYYEGARHSLLAETNRDEVFADILAWLEARLQGRPRAR
jgi:alpha-beta hydrolase superfamily lysophospholipase